MNVTIKRNWIRFFRLGSAFGSIGLALIIFCWIPSVAKKNDIAFDINSAQTERTSQVEPPKKEVSPNADKARTLLEWLLPSEPGQVAPVYFITPTGFLLWGLILLVYRSRSERKLDELIRQNNGIKIPLNHP